MQTQAAVTAALIRRLEELSQNIAATANALNAESTILFCDVDGNYFKLEIKRITAQEYAELRQKVASQTAGPQVPPPPPPFIPGRN